MSLYKANHILSVIKIQSMEWYEILLAIPVIIIGAFIRGKIYEYKKNIHHNDSWRNRKK